MSCTERLVLPWSSSKIRRPALFSASQRASASPSPCPTPSRTTSPVRISARVSPPTDTLPRLARCKTTLRGLLLRAPVLEVVLQHAGHLAIFCVPTALRLRKQEPIVDGDFEPPAVGWNEGDRRDLHPDLLEQLCHQTDGSVCIVSNPAVFNGDLERHSAS